MTGFIPKTTGSTAWEEARWDGLTGTSFWRNTLGQTVTLEDSDSFKVTGVAHIPEGSHIQFDVLLSFNTLKSILGERFDQEMTSGWLDLNVINYVLLRPGTDAEQFAAKIKDLPRKHACDILDQWGSEYQLDLEPLSRIYLYSDSGNWLGPKSNISYVHLLICVGVFLLIIAARSFDPSFPTDEKQAVMIRPQSKKWAGPPLLKP